MISPIRLFINEKVKDLIKSLPTTCSLFIFGNNHYAIPIIDCLKENDFSVKAIFDNYKYGTNVNGIPVIAPCESCRFPNAIIIIASKYCEEMTGQLKALGYIQEQIIRFFNKDYSGFGNDLLDPYYLEKYADIALKGEYIQNEIRKAFPTGTEILLSPLSCIGDMYVMCLNLDHYLEQYAITNYVIAAPGNAACDLARRFGHSRIYQLNTDESESLMEYYMMVGEAESHIHILNLSMVWASPFTNLLESAGLTWTDHYNKALYQLDTVQNKFPACQKLPDDEYALLLAGGFQEGKTIILSPYATSIEMLELSFWEALAEILHKKEFQVYTNVTPKECEINGTRRLEVPLKYIDEVLEKAGFFIAMRSGLCDVTCRADCKKIILYRDIPYFSSTPFKVFSLARMGLDSDACEYVLSEDTEYDIQKICEYIGDIL